jgi:REP element-mobilizing transposase RayT
MRSNLPHISQEEYYQFITFRTQESTDDFIKKLNSNYNLDTQKRIQYNIDKYLDTSKTGAYFYDEILDETRKYLLNINPKLCKIVSFSIMPNHIHILLIQKDELPKIMKQIKGGISFLINKKIKRKGAFWQKDYFDKVIRDSKHLEITYQYIENNAIKASLIDFKDRFYSIYE